MSLIYPSHLWRWTHSEGMGKGRSFCGHRAPHSAKLYSHPVEFNLIAKLAHICSRATDIHTTLPLQWRYTEFMCQLIHAGFSKDFPFPSLAFGLAVHLVQDCHRVALAKPGAIRRSLLLLLLLSLYTVKSMLKQQYTMKTWKYGPSKSIQGLPFQLNYRPVESSCVFTLLFCHVNSIPKNKVTVYHSLAMSLFLQFHIPRNFLNFHHKEKVDFSLLSIINETTWVWILAFYAHIRAIETTELHPHRFHFEVQLFKATNVCPIAYLSYEC